MTTDMLALVAGGLAVGYALVAYLLERRENAKRLPSHWLRERERDGWQGGHVERPSWNWDGIKADYRRRMER